MHAPTRQQRVHAINDRSLIVYHHDQSSREIDSRPHGARDLLILARCGARRDLEGESRAFAGLRSELDGVAEQLAQALDDGKAEPHALPAGPARVSQLEEFLENPLLVLRPDAHACIPYLDPYPVAGWSCLQGHFSR